MSSRKVLAQVPALHAALLERGWTDEASDYIAEKVREDPTDRFARYLIRRFLGIAIRENRPELPRTLIKQVFERDAYRCRHCDGWIDLCVDHIHPYSKGGTSEIDNLQTLCRICNSKKKDRV